MKLKDFDYELPEDLIAQYPAARRDESRLMVLERSTGKVAHRAFADIAGYFKAGDVLVLNDTRVVPSRLIGKKATGGKVEFLLTGRAGDNNAGGLWKCLAKPSRGLGAGVTVFFDKGVEAQVVSAGPDGERTVRFNVEEGFDGVLEEIGNVPLPPYIRRAPAELDSDRYQTVYAAEKGAVAAPTAGLHFTSEMLGNIKGLGVEVRYITLHTGPGTFMPVRTENIEEHRMMKERYSIKEDVFEYLLRAKRENRRIVATGTTTTRALESSVINGFDAPALEGETGLFIRPGFAFNLVGGLLTNFHLPCSTLIMLVAAFGGYDNVMAAYKEAVRERYRFFSYGDAMLVV